MVWSGDFAQEVDVNQEKTLRDVIAQHQERIMKIPSVIGVGAGISPREPGRRCILVYTTDSERPPELPEELEGYPVETMRKSKGFKAL
jgi:hypothetical protein